MYATALHRAEETRRFTIRYRPALGWEVVHESDSKVVRRAVYHDWHRVERAIAVFRHEEAQLEADGWLKTSA